MVRGITLAVLLCLISFAVGQNLTCLNGAKDINPHTPSVFRILKSMTYGFSNFSKTGSNFPVELTLDFWYDSPQCTPGQLVTISVYVAADECPTDDDTPVKVQSFDVSTAEQSMSVNVDLPGLMYVWGFKIDSPCLTNLSAIPQAAATCAWDNYCSNHGECDSYQSVCSCLTTFYPPACNVTGECQPGRVDGCGIPSGPSEGKGVGNQTCLFNSPNTTIWGPCILYMCSPDWVLENNDCVFNSTTGPGHKLEPWEYGAIGGAIGFVVGALLVVLIVVLRGRKRTHYAPIK